MLLYHIGLVFCFLTIIYYLHVAIISAIRLYRHTEISPKRKCFGDFLCPGEEKSMFNNQRYVTRGITSTVPLVTQIILWDCIDSMKVERKDYLQVFKLVANGTNQQITHSQEEPTYERTFTFPTDEPITAKIFVIDDETHTTMLLAEEY